MSAKVNNYILTTFFIITGASLPLKGALAQSLNAVEITGKNGIEVVSINGNIKPMGQMPLVSFQIGEKHYTSLDAKTTDGKNRIPGVAELSWAVKEYSFGLKIQIKFQNISSDMVMLQNVVPFQITSKNVYITGKGNHDLSRTHLFRPGFEPVNVIVPDNAWELGFSEIELEGDKKICALMRRAKDPVVKGRKHRFETEIYPGGSVEYTLWADSYEGNWQEGLRKMFQQRMLYDVEPGKFNDSLFQRKDLQWVRHAYVSHLLQNWDNYYYDYTDGKFHLEDFVKRGQKLYGGDDFIGIWPTWPTLGLDQRNQWDLFRDLPGGMAQIKKQAQMLNRYGSRLFICYNPWDQSTRGESHTVGMSDIIAPPVPMALFWIHRELRA